jgi:hypothetical protein
MYGRIYLSKHVYYLGIKIGSQVKHPVIDFDIFALGYFTCLFHNLSNYLLYRGGQLYWYPKKSTNLTQVTDTLYYIILYRVHLARNFRTVSKKILLFYIIIYSGSSAMSIICESVVPSISSCSANKHSLSFVSLSNSSSSSLEFLQCNLFYVN